MGRHLKAPIEWARYSSFRGVLILRYHRVADLPTDPNAVAVTPVHFGEQMEVLRERFQPIHLDSLGSTSKTGRLPHRGVIVTFDDGYVDNLRHALPTLERHGIPATVFVTTGYVGGTREFWWDALEAVLLRPGRLPDKLRLQTDGFKLEADLGPNAEYSEPDFTVYRGWNWRSSTDPTQRHRLFRRLSAELRRLEDGHRTRVLDELAAWAGSTQRVRPDYRALTAEEVVQLARSGLVRIGAHSVTHPLLSCQAARRQWEEIHGSRMFLEDILQTPVTTFAYPYGMSGKAAAIVKRAGFALACTTRPGIVFSRRRPYHLPRLYVGDWDGDEFERRLRSLP